MNVADLIKKLEKLPKDTMVVFRTDNGIVEPTLSYANRMLFIED